jgi:hypothetical protein
MDHSAKILLSALTFVFASGCESQADKCIKTTNETYEREVAACKDDACKAAAAKTKADFLEACKKQ